MNKVNAALCKYDAVQWSSDRESDSFRPLRGGVGTAAAAEAVVGILLPVPTTAQTDCPTQPLSVSLPPPPWIGCDKATSSGYYIPAWPFFCFAFESDFCWFRCVGTELVACAAASVIPVNHIVDLIRFRWCLGCGQIIGSMLSQYQGLNFLIVSSCKGFQASSTWCPYGCC